jgi:3-methyladenine DNA glycosylase AlkD
MTAAALLDRIRRGLKAVADPGRAPAMQAYMKSAMPFHGVSAPDLRRVCRQVFAGCTFASAGAWRRAVLGLWRGARFREERHAAILLCGVKHVTPFRDMDVLPMYEEMIVTGAWWDYVDPLAGHRLGELLRRFPRPMTRTMLAWSRDRNMWKRRAAILCQLGFRKDTDLDLLYRTIEPSLSSKEFFLRKAIGWALRQYAWTDPAKVRRYVRENEARLSPLSRREALKNVGMPTR